ncbi:MAG: hypothetical protein AB1489_41555, partial [Acidobacteriota bacterium]
MILRGVSTTISLLSLTLLFSLTTYAQLGSTSIVGNITDESGNGIAGARVIISNKATDQTR